MNRNTLIGAAVLIIILAGIVWLAATHKIAQAPGTQGTTATSTVPALGPYVEHAQYYDIAANYPTTTPLMGGKNESALVLMRGFVSDTIAQFKVDGNFANLTPQDIQTLGFDQGRKYGLQITYLIASSEHTQSYIFTIYEDTGGAHGNIVFKTFMFDKNTGALLSLKDLFAPGTDYLGTLSQMSRSKLPVVIGPDADNTFIQDGTTADDKNFQDFFFDSTDFVLLFPPYQVAAYAEGPVTLRIPASQLFSILKTGYHE